MLSPKLVLFHLVSPTLLFQIHQTNLSAKLIVVAAKKLLMNKKLMLAKKESSTFQDQSL
jgi:hypothetical protein